MATARGLYRSRATPARKVRKDFPARTVLRDYRAHPERKDWLARKVRQVQPELLVLVGVPVPKGHPVRLESMVETARKDRRASRASREYRGRMEVAKLVRRGQQALQDRRAR